ncbi:MAG: RluA family pseudouridine synthase [Betaproteobacteria bacterium]
MTEPRHALEPRLLHLDDDLLVLEKPAGMLSVPGRGPDKQDCLSRWAQAQVPGAMVVHRLDMATSGLILMARHALSQRLLGHAFEQRLIAKQYTAVVEGQMADGDDWQTIDLPLAADWPRRPLQKVDVLHGKPSLTRWRVLERSASQTRLLLEPLTGRSHQLRVHLQALGHPIVGDALYGASSPRGEAPAARLLLHASSLSLRHPIQALPLRFDSPAPF